MMSQPRPKVIHETAYYNAEKTTHVCMGTTHKMSLHKQKRRPQAAQIRLVE
jgi:hypothetical protein